MCYGISTIFPEVKVGMLTSQVLCPGRSFKTANPKRNSLSSTAHSDHIGKADRADSAKLTLQKVKDIAGKHPVIVTGDVISAPSDDPYKIITNTNNSVR